MHVQLVLKGMVRAGAMETVNGKTMSVFHLQVNILTLKGIKRSIFLCIVVTTDKYDSMKRLQLTPKRLLAQLIPER